MARQPFSHGDELESKYSSSPILKIAPGVGEVSPGVHGGGGAILPLAGAGAALAKWLKLRQIKNTFKELDQLKTMTSGKAGTQVISDIKLQGSTPHWPDLKDKVSGTILKKFEEIPAEMILKRLIEKKGNLTSPAWWNALSQYQLKTGKSFKQIQIDLGYHGESKTLSDAIGKLNLSDKIKILPPSGRGAGYYGTFPKLYFGKRSMTEITGKGGIGLDNTYTYIDELKIDP